MTDLPPLALDIDGTLTRPDHGIDPRVFDPLRSWPAPVVIATGKAFPYPIALCQFVGIDECVIAENGGIAYVDDEILVSGDETAAFDAVDEFLESGGDLGWGASDLVNRWRETEVALRRDVDETLLRRIAAEHGVEVVDTGYALHVKDGRFSKGAMLEQVAPRLGYEVTEFVAVGDSENDVSTFERVGRSYATANADDAAKAAADVVLDGEHAAGTLSVLDSLKKQ
ncbi:phosphoglycolate phosphatase [Haloarchaeobius sp. TZWWS8]|uniref:phosphoglycolate phosphatase n=1 Tax=Haloarchaeobius sp. TZWWS8 TaxID=3446121 RepID=UPI003EBC3650